MTQAALLLLNRNFNYAETFFCGVATVQIGRKSVTIDKKGNIVEPVYGETRPDFREGLALVKKERKFGYINESSELVIDFQYTRAGNFNEEVAATKKAGEKWGYVDKTGKTVIFPQFDWAGGFSNGLAPVKKGKKCGYINRLGEMVIPPSFDSAFRFKNGIAAIVCNGKHGCINTSGDFVIPPVFDQVWPDNKFAVVRMGSGYDLVWMKTQSN